ncbi:MAG: diguanylate cyclase [Actinobacteria bacterium]|nr:MAG: diguanylate cyclase [Actinomycetota bacterium]
MTEEARTLGRLRGLLDVTRVVRSESDVETLLGEVARVIAESLGFRAVVINIYRPAWDDFYVTTVYGSPEAKELLLGDSEGWDVWKPLLDERFEQRGAYVIPHGEFDWDADGVKSFVPDIDPVDEPDAWHPEDALMLPMRHTDGHVLGILSVDEPVSGRLPTDEELDVLVAVAEHAALVVQGAQEAAVATRHRSALEHLLEVSAQLTETFSAESILERVCDGIQAALGFQKVVVQLVDAETGRLRPLAAAGFDLADPVLNAPTTIETIRRLLDQQYQVAGCFLLPGSEAEPRLEETDAIYRSSQNGRGPHAWNHHWLVVPLYDRQGDVVGVIWADEPEDRLLPSKEKLQALRVFANQATTAVASAAQFEEMRFLADHDPLTRLLNRRAFMREVELESSRSERYRHAFALVLFDLDTFKAINDRHGHLVGDEALQWVASVLVATLRRSDSAFRIGGDEFALVLAEAAEKDATEVVERISAALATSMDGRIPGFRASFGIAVFPRDGGNPEELLRAADEAMYAAKASARATVEATD